MDSSEKIAEFFKALMHPVRLQILAILRDGEECVCHMEATLGLRQAYISQHLAVLREAGLVSARREGWNIYYRVMKAGVFEIIDAAAGNIASGKEEIELRGNSRPRGCPCPKCSLETFAKVTKIDIPRRLS
jgi:DNA-binding transcriptional ArsR family regulator